MFKCSFTQTLCKSTGKFKWILFGLTPLEFCFMYYLFEFLFKQSVKLIELLNIRDKRSYYPRQWLAVFFKCFSSLTNDKLYSIPVFVYFMRKLVYSVCVFILTVFRNLIVGYYIVNNSLYCMTDDSYLQTSMARASSES